VLHGTSCNKFKQDPDIIVSFVGWGGGSVLGKTVLKTEGTVFPNTNQPRLVNNMFTFFSTVLL